MAITSGLISTLTLAPIDLTMADLDALLPGEMAFSDDYHARARENLLAHVHPETRSFLSAQTWPVAEQRMTRL